MDKASLDFAKRLPSVEGTDNAFALLQHSARMAVTCPACLDLFDTERVERGREVKEKGGGREFPLALTRGADADGGFGRHMVKFGELSRAVAA